MSYHPRLASLWRLYFIDIQIVVRSGLPWMILPKLFSQFRHWAEKACEGGGKVYRQYYFEATRGIQPIGCVDSRLVRTEPEDCSPMIGHAIPLPVASVVDPMRQDSG